MTHTHDTHDTHTLSLTHTHMTHTHTHDTHTLSLTHTHMTHTHDTHDTHTDSHTHSLSLTYTHTLTHDTHTDSHTDTHTQQLEKGKATCSVPISDSTALPPLILPTLAAFRLTFKGERGGERRGGSNRLLHNLQREREREKR